MEPSRPHGIIAKITDFGMSTMMDPGITHVSGFNKGTPGYSAPEVMHSHQATKKSDVSYTYGRWRALVDEHALLWPSEFHLDEMLIPRPLP